MFVRHASRPAGGASGKAFRDPVVNFIGRPGVAARA
jgi:hypothetical protein